MCRPIFYRHANLTHHWNPVFLRAHNNQIFGLLPNGMTNLKKLREVYLNKNSLYTDLPPDIGLMEDLGALFSFKLTFLIDLFVMLTILAPSSLTRDTGYPLRRKLNVWNHS